METMNENKPTLILSGDEIDRGKTKRILSLVNNDVYVAIESLDDITAGDGAKHDQITGKAVSANTTTCNVFKLLQESFIPIAFQQKLNSTMFLASFCEMLPLEVVVRRVALGSYLKRNPHVEKGHVFDDLVVELYLKTNNGKFKGMKFDCDDPFLQYVGDFFGIYHPAKKVSKETLLSTIQTHLVVPNFIEIKSQIEAIAKQTFEIIEGAWQKLGYTLADFKIEFGYDWYGELLVADVIDNDSWRVIDSGGKHLDKQVYREGCSLETVKGKYEEVAELTGRFLS